jgi:hypothetical protein
MVEAYRERKFAKLHKLQYQAVMSFEFRAYAVVKLFQMIENAPLV